PEFKTLANSGPRIFLAVSLKLPWYQFHLRAKVCGRLPYQPAGNRCTKKNRACLPPAKSAKRKEDQQYRHDNQGRATRGNIENIGNKQCHQCADAKRQPEPFPKQPERDGKQGEGTQNKLAALCHIVLDRDPGQAVGATPSQIGPECKKIGQRQKCAARDQECEKYPRAAFASAELRDQEWNGQQLVKTSKPGKALRPWYIGPQHTRPREKPK